MIRTGDAPESRTLPFVVLALAYAAFVVYGSLLPFDFNWVAPAEAWHRLRQIPMLSLGMGDRADWVANLLLYIPLAALVTAWAGRALVRSAGVQVAVALIACGTLAVGIEFAQVWFPPRTVSLNDLVAEFIGTLVGAAAWVAGQSRLEALMHALSARRLARARAALILYVGAYLAASFFPYDFVVSVAELRQKIASGNDSLFFSTRDCGSLLRCLLPLGAEAVSVLPIGFLLVFARGGGRHRVAAVLVGGLLGVLIEVVQVFIVSGAGRGLSVATRAFGTLGGAIVAEHWTPGTLALLQRWARTAAITVAPLYLLGAAAAQGLHRVSTSAFRDIGARLGEVHWLPFYYHYFTTEANAFRSTLQTVLLYVPVGVLVWLWRLPGTAMSRNGAGAALWLAAALAAGFEALKLLTPGKRPDPTNVIIAVAAAALGHAVCRFMMSVLTDRWRTTRPETSSPSGDLPSLASPPTTAPAAVPDAARDTPRRRRRPVDDAPAARVHPSAAPTWQRSLGLVLLGLAAVFWWQQPFARVPLLVGAAALGWICWRFPMAWLVAVPALLPVLDLAPWSGRYFFDEADLLLLVVVGARLLGPIAGAPGVRAGALPRSQVALRLVYALGAVVSVAIAVLPLAPLDLNAFALYYSPYNALRVGKGLAWFVALALLLRRDGAAGDVAVRRFSVGMTVGLLATAAVVVWERWLFSGLFNFSLDYRVTGPMSSMHVGGAYLDTYLVMAAPIALLLALRGPGLVFRALGSAAVVAAGYSAAVTFSRATIVAFAVALALTVIGYAIAIFRAGEHRRSWQLGIAVGALAAAGIVALPVVRGAFFQQRFAQVAEDVAIRKQHWRESLDMLDSDWRTWLLGMGVGSYPAVHFWRNPAGAKTAAYGFATDRGNAYLRLGSGDSLYLDQAVDFRPGTDYTLTLRARTESKRGSITVPICQKWLLTSFNCEWPRFELTQTDGEWVSFERTVRSDLLGSGTWLTRRPVRLSLYNGTAGSVVEIDDVRLVGPDGEDLVRNGSFSAGGDRWFFTADSHLPWHVKNLWVHLHFEQGWLGVVSFTAILVLVAAGLGRRTMAGQVEAPALLAALLGALMVSAVDTTIDAPRLAVLLYLLVLLGGRKTAS
jgi:VanZ family protein